MQTLLLIKTEQAPLGTTHPASRNSAESWDPNQTAAPKHITEEKNKPEKHLM
jgi:hypothetical protein